VGVLVLEYAVPPGTPLDDIETWKLANPASWRTPERLERDLADPFLDEVSKRRYFGNEWLAGGPERWISPHVWDEACVAGEEIPPGSRIVIGVDCALVHDTRALVWGTQAASGEYFIQSRVWAANENAPHDVFFENGRINNRHVCTFIQDYLCKEFDAQILLYDDRYFSSEAETLAENTRMKVVPTYQGGRFMREAYEIFYALLHDGAGPQLLHNDDQVLAAQVANV
jgi:phage terminase large subunit-like protein